MEQIIRFVSVGLLATAVSLILKKSNPELQVPLAAAVLCFVLSTAGVLIQPVMALMQEAEALSGLSSAYFQPVIKCVVIGVLAKLGADLCRDGGQSAVAGAIEMGGTAAALYASLPLLTTLMGLLGRMM